MIILLLSLFSLPTHASECFQLKDNIQEIKNQMDATSYRIVNAENLDIDVTTELRHLIQLQREYEASVLNCKKTSF